MDPQDRLTGPTKRARPWWAYATGGLAFLAFAAIAAVALFPQFLPAQIRDGLDPPPLPPQNRFAALYQQLEVMPLTPVQENLPGVTTELLRLSPNVCNATMIFALAKALGDASEKRRAAQFLEGFARRCPGGQSALRQAADYYLQDGDAARAESIAEALIKEHPDRSDYWYIDGKAEVAQHRYEDALFSYNNTINLSSNPAKTGEWVFVEMAAVYGALGRNCEALDPIQRWVAIDPSKRATPRMATLTDTYVRLGHCDEYASGSETLHGIPGQTMRVQAEINGVRGTFMVDTGASLVTFNEAFATKAGIAFADAKIARFFTAAGPIDARIASAQRVRVGHLQAKDVPVVIGKQALGDNLDGLLGLSFLSRFTMTLGAGTMHLAPVPHSGADEARRGPP